LDKHSYYWLKVEDSLVAISNHCFKKKKTLKKKTEKKSLKIILKKNQNKNPNFPNSKMIAFDYLII